MSFTPPHVSPYISGIYGDLLILSEFQLRNFQDFFIPITQF